MNNHIEIVFDSKIDYLDEKYYSFIIVFSCISGVLLLVLVGLIWKIHHLKR
jgi:hypothetical protein